MNELKEYEKEIELMYLKKDNEKLKRRIDKATRFYLHELFKREQLEVPKKMPWESVKMFNILEGNNE